MTFRYVRYVLTLTDGEADALARLADAELRDPREQVRHILRAELLKRGLLPTETADKPDAAEVSNGSNSI